MLLWGSTGFKWSAIVSVRVPSKILKELNCIFSIGFLSHWSLWGPWGWWLWQKPRHFTDSNLRNSFWRGLADDAPRCHDPSITCFCFRMGKNGCHPLAPPWNFTSNGHLAGFQSLSGSQIVVGPRLPIQDRNQGSSTKTLGADKPLVSTWDAHNCNLMG